MEKNRKNRSPQHDGGGMLAQVQASVEILSPVPLGGKCGEKDYERLFIREAEVKAREGKMAYVRPEYHDRIMRITRVIGCRCPPTSTMCLRTTSTSARRR